MLFSQDIAEETARPAAPTQEQLEKIRKRFNRGVKLKSFKLIKKSLTEIPTDNRNDVEQKYIDYLELFKKVDDTVKENAALLSSSNDLSEVETKRIDSMYKAAQFSLINGENQISQDLLIQILYIDRKNYYAKKLLEFGHNLKTGKYKVQDMEKRYWEKGDRYYYGGNLDAAIEALLTYAYFDNKDPLLYERLGSCYYGSNQKKKAIEAWDTALFLDPSKTYLDDIILRTKRLIEADKQKDKERQQNRLRRAEALTFTGETQLLGVFPTQQKAYSYAQKLRGQNMEPIVEQQENGKWAVKVPKGQMKQ